MRLYTLSKRHFVLVFIVFFICFGVIVLIGIAGEYKMMELDILYYVIVSLLKKNPNV